jgi:signal transduction histidine kinase
MVRTAADRLENDVESIRDDARKQVTGSSRLIVLEVVAAVVIILLAGALLAWVLRRIVVRPVERLAADVRVVAAGAYEQEIDTSGPPELAALGRDIDGMRRRIVDDLHEVEAARDEVARAHATLEAHAAELTRSNEDLEQFAYVASHDLQEPLRKVASFCQLLQRRYANQLDERADQYISFAVDGAHRMQRLINDLLKFSRIGRVSSDFSQVPLDTVVESVANAHQRTVKASGGSITWSGLPLLAGDEPLLTALFTNLIGNAVKFRKPEQPIRIDVSARRIGDDWEITCADQGIGVDPAYADKIFVIFQRLHSREAYPGTGIGLAIAKRIVEYHGGRIWLDSSATDGATIRFTLPVEQRVLPADSEPVASGAAGMIG